MKNDTYTLNKVRKFLLDTLNYYQGLVHQGRLDLLCSMSILQSALLHSGSTPFYDDVKKRWVLV